MSHIQDILCDEEGNSPQSLVPTVFSDTNSDRVPLSVEADLSVMLARD